MRIKELTERRTGAMQHLKQMFPRTPDYVIQDFIYKNYKDNLKNIEPEIVEWLNELTWTKKVIVVKLDMFDEWTQQRLKQLIGDEGEQTADPRYQTQQNLVKKTGVSKEPIIVTVEDGAYELQEGWHRTVAALKAYPEGYKQIAYIGK
jgi:hypothetical protein